MNSLDAFYPEMDTFPAARMPAKPLTALAFEESTAPARLLHKVCVIELCTSRDRFSWIIIPSTFNGRERETQGALVEAEVYRDMNMHRDRLAAEASGLVFPLME